MSQAQTSSRNAESSTQKLTEMDELAGLKQLLANIKPGPVPKENWGPIRREVAGCFHLFQGSRQTKMLGRKLNRDTPPTDIVWQPPVLSFIGVERHGAAMMGSRLGELQTWELDLSAQTAHVKDAGHRLLRPREQGLAIDGIVAEIRGAIEAGDDSNHITWLTPDVIRIEWGKWISSGGAKRTRAGRLRRLQQTLEARMLDDGWKFVQKRQRFLIFSRNRSAPGIVR